MRKEEIRRFLSPLSSCRLQAYIESRLQLAELLHHLLSETGKADLRITTFSTSEEFCRRVLRMKKDGLIGRVEMLCDLRAARKIGILHRFMLSVFDSVRLAENHSKVLLIRNDSWRVSVITSQNQTTGSRTESAVITTDPYVYDSLDGQLDRIMANSIDLHGIYE